MMCKKFCYMLFGWLLVAFYTTESFALSVIRDAEIEDTVQQLATPIFRAAHLSPERIEMVLISDPSINAYVAGGMNIFIHTGLILECDTPESLVGVLAHETGHIRGGHLARNSEGYKKAGIQSTLGYVLGAAAAAAGSPDAAIAIMQGSQHVAQRQLLQFSREHEDAADQAGLAFLDGINLSAKGLLTILNKLNRSEYAAYGNLDPYVLTHPLTRARITHISNHISENPSLPDTLSAPMRERFFRSKAKLAAFLEPAEKILRRYPSTDQSVNARYARSIALYRLPDQAKALEELEGLIRSYPKDPYFQELKAQILFESGKILEAIPPYSTAHTLHPRSPLISLELAMAYLAATDRNPPESKHYLTSATTLLEQAHQQEKDNLMVVDQLIIAYGKQGDLGMTYLYQAERASLQGNPREAVRFVKLAEQQHPSATTMLRLKDILTVSERQVKEKRSRD